MKPGASPTEAELMSFAREHITERAALPKAIRIVPALPLTGVGKIFKRELQNREIEDALSESLRDAGVRTCLLKAGSDPRHGTRVEVSVADASDVAAAERVLGRSHFDSAWFDQRQSEPHSIGQPIPPGRSALRNGDRTPTLS